ncbi:hypothetical protein AGMMS50229_09020 [Campylobacterota bacterium]|nr:hypothetical protein AGMMS50229_09020 [Campylobacterota bacterium]
MEEAAITQIQDGQNGQNEQTPSVVSTIGTTSGETTETTAAAAKTRKPHKRQPKQEAADSVKLWIMRRLISDSYSYRLDHTDIALTEFVGIKVGEAERGNRDEMYRKMELYLKRIRARLRQAERHTANDALPEPLLRNTDRLAKLLQLDSDETAILRFAVVFETHKLLSMTINGNIKSCANEIAEMLDMPQAKARAMISGGGKLTRSGIFAASNKRDESCFLVDTIPSRLAYEEDLAVEELLSALLPLAPQTSLELADYPHLQTEIALTIRYLSLRKTGTNILLYGAPGTGKSELSRLIARELKTRLYEVATSDEDDLPLDGAHRSAVLRTAQHLLGGESLIVIDEAESVLSEGRVQHSPKASLNRLLETNAIPTIWIINDMGWINEAVLRRFDFAIHFDLPPKKVRLRASQKYAAGVVDSKTIKQIVRHRAVSPAIVARAVKVAAAVCPSEEVSEGLEAEAEQKTRSKTVRMLIDQTLYLQQKPKLAANDRSVSAQKQALPKHYHTEFIRTDCDISHLAERIAARRSARLLIYGAPGTGKSAYGLYLAKQLGKKAIIKRTSDLLSMWVGGTEKNIAEAFDEARRKGAVLIFDEVDSFLQDRRGAARSWEVTQVNEMLTQMESFNGVFVATTNLLDDLDQAAMRRFDLKMKFDYLDGDRAARLLGEECRALGLDAPNEGLCRAIAQMKTLTPGDFAAVRRRNRFDPAESAAVLVERLSEECRTKTDGGISIGF